MSRLPRWVATSIFVFLNDCSCCMICIWYYVKIELLRGEKGKGILRMAGHAEYRIVLSGGLVRLVF